MKAHFETVAADESSSFCCKKLACRSLSDDHAWHYHPEFELTWIINSSGTRFIGDSIKPFEPGDLVLTGPNLPHCWHNDVTENPESDTDLIVIQFNADVLNASFFDMPELGDVQKLLQRAASGLHIGSTTARHVTELMQEIIELRGMARFICLLQILDRLSQSTHLTTLASTDYSLGNDLNETNRRRIEHLHKFVRDNIGGVISQAKVARQMRLTAPAFSRFFRQATGMTFVGFVNLIRVNEACRLLEMGEITITQVAYECGYNNLSHFNRQFLLAKEMNPTEFLRQKSKLRDCAAAIRVT